MLKIRRSHDRLIFNMGITIHGKDGLYIETGTGCFEIWQAYWQHCRRDACLHYADVIMIEMASQITSLAIVYSIVYSDADQRKHQSSASLAFCAGNSPGTGEFPAQMASYAENVSIWWRHHVISEPSDYIKPISRGFETSRIVVVRRLTGQYYTGKIRLLNPRSVSEAWHQNWNLCELCFWLKNIHLYVILSVCNKHTIMKYRRSLTIWF